MGDSSEEAVHDLTSASEDAAGDVRGGRLRISSCRVSLRDNSPPRNRYTEGSGTR